jgi:DNA-binding CsgD family transcriptional regulator
MAADDKLLEVIGSVYEAALDASLWPTALDQVCEWCGVPGILMALIDNATRQGLFLVEYGLTDEAIQPYASDIMPSCPRTERFFAYPERQFHFDYQHLSECEISRDGCYDRLQEVTGYRYYLAAKLVSRKNWTAVVSLQRTHRQGHVGQQDIERFAPLFPHLGRAVEIAQRLGTASLQSAAALDAMGRVPFAMFVLASDGEVMFMNEAAEAVLAAGEGLCLDERRLRSLSRSANPTLQRLIASAVETFLGTGTGGGGSMRLPRPSGRRDYAVLVAPLSVQKTVFADKHPAAAVFVTDPEKEQDISAARLQDLHGLTPAEARVGAAVVGGRTVKEIARAQGTSLNTVRSQLKSVFDKLGVHRQSDLVRRLLSAPFP